MTETERSARTQVGAVLGMLGIVAAITVGALALGSNTPAAASGLEQFTSCEELQAWTAEVVPTTVAEMMVVEEAEGAGDDAAVSAPMAAGSAGASGETATADRATSSAQFSDADESADDGGTNTVVEGVDEIDIVDRVSDDRLLVSRNGALALVDLSGRRVAAELRGVPFDARISAAGGVVFIAGSSNDGVGTEVRRVRIDGDALIDDGRWTTPGYLVDARRTGDRLHVVVVDHPQFGVMPFEDGPVPCDQVWRPVAPSSTPSATLVATLPASGDLVPTAASEVTGSAGNLLVTDSSVYIATESWTETGEITTGLHRFDLASLTPTGSGSVPGTVAGPFALSEHEGNLRVATSASGGFIGRPFPVEGDGGAGIDPAVISEAGVDDAAVSAPAGVAQSQASPAQEPAPETTEVVEDPATTIPAETTTTVPEETTTTAPETTTTTAEPETTTTTTVVEETTTTTSTPPEENPLALAEVFVLDTEGDLDLIGRTGRFGHDGETIHGVRFVGDVAYVVTFLQTDPFWVIDLADPAAPAVVGELQIPGFSGYLHPVGDGRVVGFGPDGNGSVSARLFDVSNPAAPSVLDEIRLGDDSPVAYDHHAFVDLEGGQFAVPVTDYPEFVGDECIVPEPRPLPEPVPPTDPAPGEPIPVDPGIGDGSSGGGSTGSSGATDVTDGVPVPICEPVAVGGATGAAVLEVAGGRLSLVERATVENPNLYAERVVLAPDGTWLLLSWDRLAGTDGTEILLPMA